MSLKLLDFGGLEHYNELLKRIGAALPIGFIGYYPSNELPIGFLICDGREVNRELYSALYEIIGDTYGEGNGFTTFNLPDLINNQIETDYDDNQFEVTNTSSVVPCIKALFSVVNAEQVDAVTVVEQITETADKAIEQITESGEQAIEKVSESAVPVGFVGYFASKEAPTGYLVCDGREVSRTIYSNLYAAIGDTYGEGDGELTFNLPNLIERFIEGGDSDSVGTTLNAGLPDPELDILYRQDSTSSGVDDDIWGHDGYTGTTYSNTSGTDEYMQSANNLGKTTQPLAVVMNETAIYGASDTVQPPALMLLPCIKAIGEIIDSEQADILEFMERLESVANSIMENVEESANDAITRLAGSTPNPIGTIIAYTGETIPEGYLFCDGSMVSRETYSFLFDVIGTTYNPVEEESDEETDDDEGDEGDEGGVPDDMFCLPDMTDRTLWGSDVAGTVIDAGLPDIYGYFSGMNSSGTGAFYANGGNNGHYQGGDNYCNYIYFYASRYNEIYGSAETMQVPSISTRFCIKYI